jgi:uncharacterized membrane protein
VLLRQGRNPYTDSRLQDVARQLQLEAQWVTPLRRGRFAGRLDSPPLQELQTVLTNDLQSGSTPEFESDVSSPSLCFLSLVPLLLWHMENVVPFSLLCYLLLVLVSWWQAPPLLRPWVALLALANIPMWSLTMGNPLDLLCILLITLAWLQCEQRWSSALLLGLAVASKQLAWFFLPFYLVLIWRQEGLREALHRLSMARGVALVFNLPFLLWNWQAWVAGVLAPMADPLFPVGVGLIDLSIMHVLPFFPTWVYLMLEGLALIGGLACYWRWCPRSPEIAMMLAVLPLVFAWRSLPSYFAGVAYPLFILLLGRRQQEVAVA